MIEGFGKLWASRKYHGWMKGCEIVEYSLSDRLRKA